ncbi:hypothetical protein O0L34_g3912 [Tuta absoluta]|nr:hypothetical protein O0L34_g3912 [Tuta absoluta]
MPTPRSSKSKSLKKKENFQSRSISSSRKSIEVTHPAVKSKDKKKNVVKKRSPIRTRTNKKIRDTNVKRLLRPFHKFYKSRPDTGKYTRMSYTDNGLTSKERNYIICSCAQRSSRYAKLKALAFEAQKYNKVFRINGKCNALRDALVERGWVEQIPPARMNLASIRNKKYDDESHLYLALARLFVSNLVQKYVPNFIWDLKEPETVAIANKAIYNKFTKQAPLWATKQGLCASVRHNHWYFIENVAEVTSPRTYNSFDEGEKEEFDSDYKLTACTSLLKWLLSMEANAEPIFCEEGTVSLRVVVFALKRCKEYLYIKHNRDIDVKCSHATNSQWNSFLKKYYSIIAKQGKFKPDKENKMPMYLNYAKYVVRAIYKYRPQLSCEGCHNIWIIKPANSSQGRGIRLASKLAVLTGLVNKGKYVFQKYIEESMLIHDTKFDVRQYYLVTKLMPLEIWMYQDCYLKFSSQKYNLKNFHESIHLTNNAVQRKYQNCNDRHPELPQHNMWNLATFKEYLVKTGKEDVWDKIIYPGMKKSIIGIMLSCQDSTTSWKNRFELYGCDFILDKNCKPWLIEINSGPDLTPTTNVTAEICPAVLSDLVRVVIDRADNPNACTGKFECIFRQNISTRTFGRTDNLIIQGSALPSNYFCRGVTEEPIKDCLAEKINNGKQKKKNSHKGNLKQIKFDAFIENPVDSVIRITNQKEHKSSFSLHSSASSNNFRHLNNQKYSYDMKTEKPIQSQFDFSKLDNDDENCDSDEITNDDIVNTNIPENCDPQIPTQESGGNSNKPATSETVKAIVVSRSAAKVDHANGVQIDTGSVKKNDDFREASKELFSFLDRKHHEYVKDMLFPQK